MSIIFYYFYDKAPIANFIVKKENFHLFHQKNIVHLTGFGPFKMYFPFKDIRINPSELVAQDLNNTYVSIKNRKYSKSMIYSSVLNVTREDITSFEPHQEAIALIHLGFDDEMKGMGLEIMAENKLANTRSKPIIKKGPKLLPTTVDLSRSFLGAPKYFYDASKIDEFQSMAHTMYDQYFINYHTKFLVNWSFSRDAGGFFCNELFYRSLYRVRQESNQTRTKRKIAVPNRKHMQAMPVLFVHLPPVEIIPLKSQSDFVLQVIDEILSTLDM